MISKFMEVHNNPYDTSKHNKTAGKLEVLKTLLATVITNNLSNNGLAMESKDLAKVSDEGDLDFEKRIAENGERGTFGFNEMEKEKEISDGDYDFGARIYDSKIGRWLSTDPLAGKYPNFSPYNFVGGNPIAFIDPDRRRIEPAGRREEMFLQFIRDNADPDTRTTLEILDRSDVIYRIEFVDPSSKELLHGKASGNTVLEYAQEGKSATQVNLFITDGRFSECPDAREQLAAGAEELDHAAQFETGQIGFGRTAGEGKFSLGLSKNIETFAISYDILDEASSKLAATKLLNSCDCTATKEIAYWSLKMVEGGKSPNLENYLETLNEMGYDKFSEKDLHKEESVEQTIIRTGSELKEKHNIKEVIYRKDGETKIEKL